MAGQPIGAVVDANVLYQRYPRNLVVWLAVEGSYRLLGSEHIFAELREHLIERNLAKFGEVLADKVHRTIELIVQEVGLGAGAIVNHATVESLIETVKANDPDDRHVLAAAVELDANYIVTHDLDGFDPAECAGHGVDVIGLDDFLVRVADQAEPDAILAALEKYARYPPNSMDALLGIVEEFAPNFTSAVRDLLAT